MKKNQIKLSLVIGTGSLFLIPTTAYSSSLNNHNSLTKVEQSITLIAQNNDNSNYLMNQGWNLYISQQYQEAINYYDQAINLNPNFWEAWFAKALALSDLERYEEAITSLDRVINLDQDNADAYGLRGSIYLLINNREQGISNLQKAAQLFQEQNQQQAYQDTIELLQIVLSEDDNNSNQNQAPTTIEFGDNNPYNLFDQGYSFYELEQYDQAINAFSEAIKIKPDFAEAYGLRGGVYFLLGNKENALADLETASQLFTIQNNSEGYQKIQEFIQVVQEN